MAGLSPRLTHSWQGYWLYLWKCLLSCGHIERLSEKEGSAGMFFLKGHSAEKGTASIRIEAKGPCVILLVRCNRCRLHSHSFSVTLIFSPLPLSISANNLCLSHFHCSSPHLYFCGVRNSLRTCWIDLKLINYAAGKEKGKKKRFLPESNWCTREFAETSSPTYN